MKRTFLTMLALTLITVACVFSGCDELVEVVEDELSDVTQNESSENYTSSTYEADATASAPEEADVPTEYKSALKKAENYSEMLHMSKSGIYDQLVSEYDEKFSADAAQYAIDNLN